MFPESRAFPPHPRRNCEGTDRLVIKGTILGSPYPVRMPDSPQHAATQLLGDVGTRLPHTRRVAEQASMVSNLLDDRWIRVIVDAAWLHDIGHSPALSTTGL